VKIDIEETAIRDCFVVKPGVFEDQRGFFQEVFRRDEYEKGRLPTTFVQLNHSGSVRDTVRGLHFQWDPPMGKLMRVTRGTAFLVAVDLRRNSPTLGKYFAKVLSENDRQLIWAPASFARGFAVLSEFAEIEYLTTGIYNSAAEAGIAWNDPEIGISWPLINPILSSKDADAPPLAKWLEREESHYFRI
jgi:dTDP-4-dehydrorhamnose 3,5-epimerase